MLFPCMCVQPLRKKVTETANDYICLCTSVEHAPLSKIVWSYPKQRISSWTDRPKNRQQQANMPSFSKAEHYNTIFFFLKLISCKYLAHNFSPSLLLVRLLFSVDAVCIKYYFFLPVYWYVVLNFSRIFFQRFSHGHFRNGWNHLMKRILKCKIIIEFVNYWWKVIIELLMLIECA